MEIVHTEYKVADTKYNYTVTLRYQLKGYWTTIFVIYKCRLMSSATVKLSQKLKHQHEPFPSVDISIECHINFDVAFSYNLYDLKYKK